MKILLTKKKGFTMKDGSINVNPNSLTILKKCYMEPATSKRQNQGISSSL